MDLITKDQHTKIGNSKLLCLDI